MRIYLTLILDTLQLLHQKYNFGVGFKVALGIVIFCSLFLAIHLSQLLFGTNSLSVYFSLSSRKEYLQSQIQNFHIENAKLQKEFFELKNLEPEQ